MKFRSGTLERSVKRWGRFPRGRGKVQRVGHSWKYVELANTAVTRDGTSPTDITLFSAVDYQVGAVASGCKNVSFDIQCVYAWTPASNSASIFHSATVRWGVFQMDADDVPVGGTALEDTFATTRALKWGMFGRNFNGMDLDGTLVTRNPSEDSTYQAWRFSGRARFVKFDEELRFILQNSTDLSDVHGDCRLHMWGRLSWETP